MEQLGPELHAVTAAGIAEIVGVLPVSMAVRFWPLVEGRAVESGVVTQRNLGKTVDRCRIVKALYPRLLIEVRPRYGGAELEEALVEGDAGIHNPPWAEEVGPGGGGILA